MSSFEISRKDKFPQTSAGVISSVPLPNIRVKAKGKEEGILTDGDFLRVVGDVERSLLLDRGDGDYDLILLGVLLDVRAGGRDFEVVPVATL